MACRCLRNQCVCSDCPECRATRCRCCADAALAALPPDHLVHAHSAHMTALAHLELALAALSGSTTEKLSWTDWAKQKVKAAQDAVKAGAAKLKKATIDDNKKAVGAVLYKIVKPLADTPVGRAIANSKGAKSIGDAIKAGSKEKTTATAEHDAHDEEFERRRQEEDVSAAKSKHSPSKIGPHGYEVGDI
jgi:hypothetical protein